MPHSTHIDNGSLRLIATEDCPGCGEFDSLKISENEVVQLQICKRCGFEETIDLRPWATSWLQEASE